MSEERRVIELKDEYTPIKVPGTACLWFTWADPTLDGPQGDSPVCDYQPVEVNVEGISKILVTAAEDDKWWHHPGNDSNADGIDDERDLEDGAYRSEKYRSLDIKAEKTRLNLLVGLLGDNNPPGTEVIPIKIGREKPIDIDGVNETRLFLGFYDGREWSNNGGHANVTIQVISRK